jgi:hypothetical protein
MTARFGPSSSKAHVDLLGDAGQQLRQGLVDGIQGDVAGDAGMDVDIDFGVAGQGKQQVADRHVVDDDAIGFGLAGGRGLGRASVCWTGAGMLPVLATGGACRVEVPFERLAWEGAVQAASRRAAND